jgi:Fe-S-cluster-containing dehydrogenase component
LVWASGRSRQPWKELTLAKVIVVDSDKCYACLSCVVECGYRRAGVRSGAPLDGGILASAGCDVVAAEMEPVPLVCSHCEDAPCIMVCPSGAISRTGPGEPVLLDTEQCIGCRACVMACPFGMIRMRPDGKTAIKCDLCVERLAEGQRPLCVAACPTGALELREVDEVIAEVRKRAAAALRSGRHSA